MRSAASAKQNDTRLYGYGPSRKLNQHCSGKAARSVAGAPQAIQGPRATAHNREAPEARKRYQGLARRAKRAQPRQEVWAHTTA